MATTWQYNEATKRLIMVDADKTHQKRIEMDLSNSFGIDDVLDLLKPEIVSTPELVATIPNGSWQMEIKPTEAAEPRIVLDVTTKNVLVREHQRLRKGRVETVKAHSKTATKKVAINLDKLQLALDKAQAAFIKAKIRLEKAQCRDERHKCYAKWLEAAERDFSKVETRLAAAKATLAQWV